MDVFALLAEPVRFRIVEILATGEHTSGNSPTCCTTNSASAGRRCPASQDAGERLRRSSREGPSRVYRLARPPSTARPRVDRLHELWNARYGWPYRADPLVAAPADRASAAESWSRPARSQRAPDRRRRHRGQRPLAVAGRLMSSKRLASTPAPVRDVVRNRHFSFGAQFGAN